MPPQNPPLTVLPPGGFVVNNDVQTGTGNIVDFATYASGAASGYMPTLLPAMLPAAIAAANTIASGLTASGTTITNAFLISSQFNYFGTVASGTAARLPASPSGAVWIGNFGVSGLSVFPPTSGGTISGGSAGAAYLQATGTMLPYVWFGGLTWAHG